MQASPFPFACVLYLPSNRVGLVFAMFYPPSCQFCPSQETLLLVKYVVLLNSDLSTGTPCLAAKIRIGNSVATHHGH